MSDEYYTIISHWVATTWKFSACQVTSYKVINYSIQLNTHKHTLTHSLTLTYTKHTCTTDDSAVQLEDNLEHKYLVIGYDSLLVHGKRNHKKKKVKCFISPRVSL